MNILKNIFGNVLATFLVVVVCAACKDGMEDNVTLSRYFSPAGFTITQRETSVDLEWDASLFTTGDVEYTLEASKDAAFSTIEYSTTTTNRRVTISDSEIAIKTGYYARVKALAKNGSGDSNWLVSATFRILGEQFLLPVPSADIIDNKVIMHWKIKPGLTKIIFTAGAQSIEVALNGTDVAEGLKLISGLSPGTLYTAEIFQGTLSKGTVTFTTKAAVTGNIIDLRNIVGKPSILVDTLPDIAPGSVVLLKRGNYYEVKASYAFDKTVTVLSGLDFGTDLATIRLTSNFSVAAGSAIDSIVFKDIIFKGSRAANGSYNSDYIVNTLATVNPKATITNFRLDNCIIKILRGVVRLQAGVGGVEIQNYFVNNCVVDSIREYGVATASALSFFKNISITSSTIYKTRRFIVHAVAGNNSLKIQDCTFNNLPSNGATSANYFIDFGAANSANPIILKGCILGNTWDEVGTGPISGYRAGTGTVLSVTDSYSTSDFVVVSPMPGITSYSGSSTALFANPANGDFKLKDVSFIGKSSSGDPRWR